MFPKQSYLFPQDTPSKTNNGCFWNHPLSELTVRPSLGKDGLLTKAQGVAEGGWGFPVRGKPQKPKASWTCVNNCTEQNKLETNMKIGRNDKCPCGSNKKYKHCCANKNVTRESSTPLSMSEQQFLGYSRERLPDESPFDLATDAL